MTSIEQLNRRLGERLGTVRSGTLPRFKWMLATEDPYWGEKLGPRWVMCQWQENAYSPAEWAQMFEGRRAYLPAFHQVQAETALAYGDVPDGPLTENLIQAIDKQLQTTEEEENIKIEVETRLREDAEYERWVEKVQNDNYSAFDNKTMVGYGKTHTAGLPLY